MNKRNFNSRNKFQGNRNQSRDTSWQVVAKEYNNLVGSKGQYFHEKIIFPKALKLLELKPNSKVLDLGCGQGVFSKQIPQTSEYEGIDLSSGLIEFARKQNNKQNVKFSVADITKDLNITNNDFSHAIIILALQNVEDFDAVFRNASKHLVSGGKFLIVLNHPYFRIPKQTSWEIDERNKIQYRRINRYKSPIKIPIDMAPGQRQAEKLTWSFHNPLENYTEGLRKNGFLIETIQEWVSDKISVGRAAKMENRAREEFPMFMAVLSVKK